MIYSVKSKPFLFGLLGGLILFIILNVWVYFASHCHHCPVTIGFPFPVHQEGFIGLAGGGEYHYEHVQPEHLVANIILILLSSLGLGLISELALRRLKFGVGGIRQ